MRETWRLLAGRRDLRLVLSAGLISVTGDWILTIGLMYRVYVVTGSTVASALTMASSFAPQVLLGAVAGVFADRWDRKRTMIAANLLLAAGLVPLLLVRTPGQIWIVFVVMFWEGCVQQFFSPAQQAMVPRLVPEDELLAANELHMLYGMDLVGGVVAQARQHLEAAIAAAEGLGDEMYLYFFREDLAILMLIENRPEDALPLVRRCLQVARRSGIRLDVCEVLFCAACCAAYQSDLVKAARLHGAADVRIGYALADGSIKWSPTEEGLRQAEQGKVREVLGEVQYGEAYRQGAALSRQQAVDLALH